MTAFDKYAPKSDRPDIERDRWGRPKLLCADGKRRAHTRMTTISGTLDDRRSLEKWLQRQVAIGIAKRPDLLSTFNPDDRDAVQAACEAAHEIAGSQSKANEGQMMHTATELLDAGTPIADIPLIDKFKPHLEAYAEAVEGFTWQEIEPLVVLDAELVAGSPDRIGLWNGRPTIFDLKTGSTLDYSWKSICVQLAGYSRADWIYRVGDEETREPMPEVNQDIGVVIHLPVDDPGRCDFYEVDLNAGWEAFNKSMEVRRWRSAKNDAIRKPVGADWRKRGRGKRAPQPTELERLQARLAAIPGQSEVAAHVVRKRWPAGAGKPDKNWSAEQIALAHSLLDTVETEFELSW